MNTKQLKLRTAGKSAKSMCGDFLFRRNRRGAVDTLTDAAAKISRSKVSEK
ncbi:hypothetical protein [Pleionea sediminis]|uniref:hypothetical protein n=1 Tax=Pleionea sediminis TaxID=2569479 RepID=UPI0013DE40BD|nr:hypothetical protein [Pleionea sediminis]